MSNLIVDWLNIELGLSEPVNSLEVDLQNGFLLGEILHRHNQLHTFHQFMQNDTSDAKINNFCLLEPVLRSMGIKFDAETAYSVMQGRPRAGATLLYKVKMILDRLVHLTSRAGGAPVSSYEPVPGGVMPLPNMPVRLSKPKYDRASQAIFEAAVRQLVENQTNVLIKTHLRPFEEEGERHDARVQASMEQDASDMEQMDTQMRNRRLYEQHQNREFMQAYEQRGLEVWMENQERAKTRLQVRKNVSVKQATTRMALVDTIRDKSQAQVTNGIRDFEARLALMRTHGGSGDGDPAVDGEGGGLDSRVLDPQHRERDMQEQIATMRQHKRESERLSLAREKRRRRFITEREEAQVADFHLRAAEHLRDQLSRNCIAEESMLSTLNLVSRHRAMMTDNRSFRQTQYKMRADVDGEESLKRDNAHLEVARAAYAEELDAQVARYGMSLEARACAQRTRNEELCLETLYRVVDLALEVAAFRRFAPAAPETASEEKSAATSEEEAEEKAKEKAVSSDDPAMGPLVPALAWQDMKRVFVGGLPLIMLDGALSSERVWGQTSSLKLKSAAEETEEAVAAAAVAVPGLLDGSDFTDYVQGQYPWKDEGVDTVVSDALAAEAPGTDDPLGPGVIPYYALGEVVINARLVAEPLPEPPPPPVVPKFDMRLCFCGKSFSGKSEQAYLIADRYSLKAINTEAMLSEAIDVARDVQFGRLSEDDLEAATFITKELAVMGQMALGCLMRGQVVPDEVYARLVVAAVHRVQQENNEMAAEKVAAEPATGAEDGEAVEAVEQEPAKKLWKGWVVEDFPETAAQAALLEKLLSGYDGSAHKHTRWDRMSVLADPIPQPPPDLTQKIPSGIDMVVYFEAEKETVLQRSLGRRLDPETEKSYHLDTNRPPYDVVCKERLLMPVDPCNPAEQLSLQVAAHDLAADSLKSFLNQFGTLKTVESNTLSAQGVFAEVVSLLSDIAAAMEAKEALTAEEPAAESEPAAAAEAAEADGTAAEGGEAEAAAAEGEAAVEAAVEEPAATEEPAPPAEEAVVEAAPSSPPSLSQPLAIILVRLWNNMEEDVTKNMKNVFRALREERLFTMIHLHDLRVRFSEFLRRPDDKQTAVSSFLTSFNSIQEDMRFDDLTKCELHLRCEELRMILWTKTEEREEAARARLESVRGDGWLEERVASIERNYAFLMQLELDRLNTSLRMLFDHHAALTGEGPEGILEEIDIEDPAGGGAVDDKGGKGKKGADKGAAKEGSGGRSIFPTDIMSVCFDGPAEDGDKKDAKKKGAEEEEEPVDSLAVVTEAANAAVQPWLPEAFPVPEPTEGTPSPASLHSAIWVSSDGEVFLYSRLGPLYSHFLCPLIFTRVVNRCKHSWHRHASAISLRRDQAHAPSQ